MTSRPARSLLATLALATGLFLTIAGSASAETYTKIAEITGPEGSKPAPPPPNSKQ